jgi:hypothetical protein
VADADAPRPRGQGCAGCAAMRHLLAAVHQALSLPAPLRQSDQLPHLLLLEQRAGIAAASIGRLLTDPQSGELDFISEGDHILHQIADLPPDSYHHQPD